MEEAREKPGYARKNTANRAQTHHHNIIIIIAKMAANVKAIRYNIEQKYVFCFLINKGTFGEYK